MKNDIEDNNNSNKTSRIVILFIILILMVINIEFLILSSTLKIKGNGIIRNDTWDIHFENVKEKSQNTTLLQPITLVEKTTKLRYVINLNGPESYYEFETDVKNSGTIDAKLATEPTISGITTEQEIYTNYIITYSDNTPIKVGDIIKAGTSKTIKVRVEMDKAVVNSQFTTLVQQLGISVDLDYIQAE